VFLLCGDAPFVAPLLYLDEIQSQKGNHCCCIVLGLKNADSVLPWA
jgi:hypothetical protein